jgi:hypothetical protein
VLQWTKWVRFCAQVRPNQEQLMSGFNNLRIAARGFWLSSKIKMVV